jgi:maltooligosyltrehalose trehalohydrolase
VIYELHVGTFTPGDVRRGGRGAGRRRGARRDGRGGHADRIVRRRAQLGVRRRRLYAPAAPYGGPEAFKRFVDAAHAVGIAVILDVVYNHLGPRGQLPARVTGGRFFTDRALTPWGDAVNYDGRTARPVRDFVIQNALLLGARVPRGRAAARRDARASWTTRRRTCCARSPGGCTRSTPRRVLIAEDERNERRVVLPRRAGGIGLDAVWADDLHHQVRRLAGRRRGGLLRVVRRHDDDVVRTLRRGWYFEAQVAEHRGAARGTPAEGCRRARSCTACRTTTRSATARWATGCTTS